VESAQTAVDVGQRPGQPADGNKASHSDGVNEKLYVGNRSSTTTAEDLEQLFAQAGTVSACDLFTEYDTGQSKGLAFVTMATQAEAENATSLFNVHSLGDRALTVNTAKPCEARSSFSNRGQSRGGGYRKEPLWPVTIRGPDATKTAPESRGRFAP
jgi:RNA recognition motif-containing protein